MSIIISGKKHFFHNRISSWNHFMCMNTTIPLLMVNGSRFFIHKSCTSQSVQSKRINIFILNHQTPLKYGVDFRAFALYSGISLNSHGMTGTYVIINYSVAEFYRLTGVHLFPITYLLYFFYYQLSRTTSTHIRKTARYLYFICTRLASLLQLISPIFAVWLHG